MSLLNYWNDYIKEKINSINNFKLVDHTYDISISDLGSDATITRIVDSDLGDDDYLVGFHFMSTNISQDGVINLTCSRYCNSANSKGVSVNIENLTAHTISGTITIKLTFLKQL